MALFNPRNLTAPFTNRVHFVAILLAAVAFTILRIAGGGIRVEKVHPAENMRQPVGPSEIRRTLPKPLAPWNEQQIAPATKRPVSTPSERRSRGSALDDIERELGLR